MLVTVETAMQLHVQSVSYIDNRQSPSILAAVFESKGPNIPKAIGVIQNAIYALNNWLADGILVSSLFGAAFAHPWVSDAGFSSSIVVMLYTP